MTTGGIGGAIISAKPVGPTVCGVGTHESVALTLIVKLPFTVGVPESKPPAESVSPAGTPVPDHEIGAIPPLELNWNE